MTVLSLWFKFLWLRAQCASESAILNVFPLNMSLPLLGALGVQLEPGQHAHELGLDGVHAVRAQDMGALHPAARRAPAQVDQVLQALAGHESLPLFPVGRLLLRHRL